MVAPGDIVQARWMMRSVVLLGAGAHATLASECRVAPPGSDSCGGSVVGMEREPSTVADMQARSLKR